MKLFRTSLIALTLLSAPSAAEARVLGTTVSKLQLADGAELANVRFLSCSPEKQTVAVAANRTLRTLPLAQLPLELRRQILADYDYDRSRREANVFPTTTTHPASTLGASSSSVQPHAQPQPPAGAAASPDTPYASLERIAAEEALAELRFHLQKQFQRVTQLECKVRTAEKISGWQQIRTKGVASFSRWDKYQRDYVWQTAPFEVVFDIVDGRAVSAASVSFNGISRTVDQR
jgi:hypothetical protein